MFWRMLSIVQNRIILAIPLAMAAGIAAGHFADMSFTKAAVIPLTFLMVYPMMVNLEINKIFSFEGVWCQLVALVINFGLIPFLALWIGKAFFPDEPMIALGLLLASLLPTSGMTISWTGFAKGNMGAAIQMTVIGLVSGSVATPFYAKWLMGEVVEIPMMQIFISIFAVVFLPMALGYATRLLLVRIFGDQKYRTEIRMKFPMLATVGVVGIVFVAMSLKARAITGHPAILLVYLGPLALLYAANFLISTIVGKLVFNRGDAIALVYGTVMRNLSIALAIAMTAFADRGSEIAIILALAYIVQVQSAAWYVRFTDSIFGKA